MSVSPGWQRSLSSDLKQSDEMGKCQRFVLKLRGVKTFIIGSEVFHLM